MMRTRGTGGGTTHTHARMHTHTHTLIDGDYNGFSRILRESITSCDNALIQVKVQRVGDSVVVVSKERHRYVMIRIRKETWFAMQTFVIE